MQTFFYRKKTLLYYIWKVLIFLFTNSSFGTNIFIKRLFEKGGENVKKVINVLSVILVFILTISVCSIAFADDSSANDDSPERFSIIKVADAAISISGITATCYGSVTAYNATTLTVKLELQKKKSGVYETIKTWTESKSNSKSFSLTKTRGINVLSDYRLKATLSAGSESTTIYDYP